MYACLFQPPAPEDRACGQASAASGPAPRGLKNVVTVAADFSPRFERHGDDLVSIDISGLGRLFGSPRDIGEELRRDAASRGLRVHVAIASTRTAALVLAMARPGLTVVEPGNERDALASIPIRVLENVSASAPAQLEKGGPDLAIFRNW